MNLTTEEKGRYSRHLLLSEIGIEGQEKIKASKVLVIGAGGLGCPALQYLAAAGVGTIGIIDMDVVEQSNLQRQILYGVSDIGNNKAESAKFRLKSLNPLIEIEAYPYALNTNNALTLFNKYDIIVDGSDNFATRYLVNDASVITKKALVYGSIYRFEGQVSVFNYKDGPSYRCLFPDPPKPGEAPACSETGVLGVLPGIIGCMQANETLKIILDIGNTLSGRLLIYNSLTCETMTLNIQRNNDTVRQTIEMKEGFEETDYHYFCGTGRKKQSDIKEISAGEFFKNIKDYTILDVRELWEQPRINGSDILDIPLPRIIEYVDKIPKDKTVVVICAKGIRSKIAIQQLKKQGYTNLINLSGGIKSMS